MKTKPADDIAENEAEMAAAVVNAAKKTLISAVVKRNVIENIVPIVISLKHTVRRVKRGNVVESRFQVTNNGVLSGTQLANKCEAARVLCPC